MLSVSDIPDPNPTRAQLRLVVLGEWIRAGLALARGARAGRGLVGGAVALWRVFQAIRLAMQLTQRLSELQGVLPRAALETAPAAPDDPDLGSDFEFGLASDAPPWSAAILRSALAELAGTIRDALGGASAHRLASDGAVALRTAAEPEAPRAASRLQPLRGRPPDRPPRPQRWRARRRRPCAPCAFDIALTPIAATAIGREPLARPLGAWASGPR
jgi:hypothetical protein